MLAYFVHQQVRIVVPHLIDGRVGGGIGNMIGCNGEVFITNFPYVLRANAQTARHFVSRSTASAMTAPRFPRMLEAIGSKVAELRTISAMMLCAAVGIAGCHPSTCPDLRAGSESLGGLEHGGDGGHRERAEEAK